jgi:hypothetical protein
MRVCELPRCNNFTARNRQRFCSRKCANKAKTRPLKERVWEKIEIRGLDECWPWQAGTNEAGYGKIGVGGKFGKTDFAHRIVWRLTHKRKIPKGMFVILVIIRHAVTLVIYF